MERSLTLVVVLCVATIATVQIGIVATEANPCPFCGTWVRVSDTARVELHISVYGVHWPFLDIVRYVYPFDTSEAPRVFTLIGMMVVPENVLVTFVILESREDDAEEGSAMVDCYTLVGETALVTRVGLFTGLGDDWLSAWPFLATYPGDAALETFQKVTEFPAVTEAPAISTGPHFTGDADKVTDSFTLPAGTYRVHVVTAGYLMAKATRLADPTDYTLLFFITPGRATSGASALYVSTGQPLVVEFSIVSAPYELWFERIQ
jgi:hypothetical protein